MDTTSTSVLMWTSPDGSGVGRGAQRSCAVQRGAVRGGLKGRSRGSGPRDVDLNPTRLGLDQVVSRGMRGSTGQKAARERKCGAAEARGCRCGRGRGRKCDTEVVNWGDGAGDRMKRREIGRAGLVGLGRWSLSGNERQRQALYVCLFASCVGVGVRL